MKQDVQIVARTKNEEIPKGSADNADLDNINDNGSIYLHLENPGNTFGTCICQDQLEGLYLVKTFEGQKPLLPVRLYKEFKNHLKNHFPLTRASAVVAILSMVGLTTLM